jgi:trans-aconitate 2-methyltransferase
MRWDPAQYLQFGDERARPFADLLSRVGAATPARVVDLGCGPGNLTRSLAARWPGARVEGLDSSPAMVERATTDGETERLTFTLADLREWEPTEPVDVLTSNATLQWVPEHLGLLPRFVSWLAPGGWLAFQLPGNFRERTHTAIADVASSPRWRDRLAGADLQKPSSHEPATYLGELVVRVASVDVWETTYLQVLRGKDAVVQWMRGTGLGPVLTELDDEEGEEFLAAYRGLVAAAYPERPWGTVLPYRRIFVVAQR